MAEIAEDKIVQTVLTHYPSVDAIYIFGTAGTEHERQQSDIDLALLFPVVEAKAVQPMMMTDLYFELEKDFKRKIDLINLRMVPTVLQKEIIAAERMIYCGNETVVDEFEMLTISYYQKLNEERKGIIEAAVNGGRFYNAG
ncbi:MAG: type VII toxin-antitoxin system MntA family adenylyltransferase antitoxin [Planctomycetota bacterium]|jgi:predicted nucleotidyltransferase